MATSLATRDRWLDEGGTYELRTIRLPPGHSEAEARRMLTDAAEYGRWELTRSTLYWGGGRTVILRRKAIDVRATLRAGAFNRR